MKRKLLLFLSLLIYGSTAWATGETCSNPWTISLPANLPYRGTGTTCGKGNNITNSGCLPAGYENGEDATYRLTVTSRLRINITLNTSVPTPRPAFSLNTSCPPSGQCLRIAYSSSAYWISGRVTLDPGTYYLQIDNMPAPNCIGAYGLDIDEWPLLPGDDCSDPIEIASLPASLSNNTGNFNADMDSVCGVAGWARDVVYKYVPPHDMQVTFDLCLSSFDSKLYIYDGYCEGTPMICADSGAGVCPDPTHPFLPCVSLTSGHTYYIVVDGAPNAQGDYTLVATECVSGGTCAAPREAEITYAPYVDYGTTCGYGDDHRNTCLEEVDPAYDHGEDIIYRLTFIGPGYYLISLRSSTPGAQIGWAISRVCPPTGSCWEKAAVHADSAERAIQISYLDDELYLYIDNCAGCGDPAAPSCFSYTLSVTHIADDQGETCWNPWILTNTPPFSFTGNTVYFGYADNSDWPCPNASNSPDVVYQYHPATDMNLTFSLAQSGYDTKFYIFEGNAYWYGCYGPAVACNDDDQTGHCPDPTRSYVSCVSLLAGHYYYLVVDGANGAGGDYRVDVSVCQPGETCESAIPITAPLPQTITGSTCGFGNDLDAVCPNASTSPDVVYSYTPTVNENVTFMLCGSSYDTKLSVYDDCAGAPLYCNDDAGDNCQDDGTRSFLGCLPLLAGHRYYIVVDGANGECGDYVLTVGVCLPDRPCSSCTPPNAILGDVTTTACGDSIQGNLGYQGKWIGQFNGIAGATYHWDLCPFDPCGGHAEYVADPADVDILIMDSTCQRLDWNDGDGECSWRPNDWQWICPATGTYYAWITPWPSFDNEVLNCAGTPEHTFTLVYYRGEPPLIPGESCEDAPLITGSLPLTLTGNTCSFSNNYDISCVQETDVNGKDVVYKYIPAEDGWLSLGICEASFDPKLILFADSCSGDPYACNDRESGFCEDASRPYLGCIPITAGRTYYIVVDGVNEWECGEYVLTLDACSPVPGDIIETAFPISALPFTATGTTEGFFDQYSPECNGGRSAAPDVVYSYSPAGDESIEIELCNSCFENRLYIYENSPANLIVTDDAGCWPGSRAYIPNVALVGGATYYFVIDGDGEDRGTYQLDILPWVGGRGCRNDGECFDNVTSRQCSYHLGRADWTAGVDCGSTCPTPIVPPAALRTIPSPVINGCGYGVTVAATCAGELFYTNTCNDTLYKINAFGQLQSAVLITENGNPLGVNLGTWDPVRQLIWAQTWSRVGTVNPLTGEFTERFQTPSIGDQIAFDKTDGTLWQKHWGCSSLLHLDTLGNALGTLDIRDGNGTFDGYVNGITVGPNNTLYLSHADTRVTQNSKSTGNFISLIAQHHDSAGRAIACDGSSFYPQTVLWWKFDNSFSAYPIESGSCDCICPKADSVTVCLNIARTNMQVNFHAAVADSFRILSTTSKTSIYPTGFSAAATILAAPGLNTWTDPAAIADYKRYVVVHVCR
jgi:hypothetical protein